LLRKAKQAGWKRSGIMSFGRRIILELFSTEKLELPVANRGEIIVDDKYLKLLVKEAEKKLKRTEEKIKNLGALI
jgi:tRNA wybutosine-synthesizing protein 3